jgi:hypothetical protein
MLTWIESARSNKDRWRGIDRALLECAEISDVDGYAECNLMEWHRLAFACVALNAAEDLRSREERG